MQGKEWYMRDDIGNAPAAPSCSSPEIEKHNNIT